MASVWAMTILHFIDVVLDPVIAASGKLGALLRPWRLGLWATVQAATGIHRADLGADQLPRGNAEVLAH